MARFEFTKLEADEAMIFGPLTISKGNAAVATEGGQMSRGGFRLKPTTLGISNQRVIVERIGHPEETQHIPVSAVKTLYLRREKFAGYNRVVVVGLQTSGGEEVSLDLTLMDPEAESKLQAVFTHSQFKEKRGCLSFMPFLE
jgi:hypothetical protein